MLDTLGSLERTHTCGELREADVGKQAVLMGWVAKKRDFGVLTFIDLRDRDGMTQVVLNEEDAGDAHAKAKNLRGEEGPAYHRRTPDESAFEIRDPEDDG